VHGCLDHQQQQQQEHQREQRQQRLFIELCRSFEASAVGYSRIRRHNNELIAAPVPAFPPNFPTASHSQLFHAHHERKP